MMTFTSHVFECHVCQQWVKSRKWVEILSYGKKRERERERITILMSTQKNKNFFEVLLLNLVTSIPVYNFPL